MLSEAFGVQSSRQSVQRLALESGLFDALVSGQIMSAVRYQVPTLSEGLLEFYAEQDPSLSRLVQVLCCTCLPLRDVAEFLGKGEEWSDRFVLETMQAVYPRIELSDSVQVLEFEVL